MDLKPSFFTGILCAAFSQSLVIMPKRYQMSNEIFLTLLS